MFQFRYKESGAAIEIAKGIKLINEKKLADVIIIARGGGSLEDLWPFNEEIVARAIFNSSIPIISAVGHETDFTISDFVADLRAPTPSAAAELANPDIYELKNKITVSNERLRLGLNKKIELMRLKLNNLTHSKGFNKPLNDIQNNYLKIDNYVKQISSKTFLRQNKSEKVFQNLVSKLDALSPLKTLARGYVIAEKNGKMIKKSQELEKNEEIKLKFVDGVRSAKII